MSAARIDRWLWHTRFFKTRSLAAAAVKAGRVRVNGQRAKSSRELGVGDRLTVVKGTLELDVVVDALPERRGSATAAAGWYTETPESLERRRLDAEQHAADRRLRTPTEGRPDKRTRRLIREQRGR